MKKSKHLLTQLLASIFLLFSLAGCDDDPDGLGDKELPVVQTTAISELTDSSVTTGGVIVSDGGLVIASKGVCWSTTENPTINDNKTSDGAGKDPFVSRPTGLMPNTTYFLRAYAVNAAGTAYGETIEFTTLQEAVLPEVETRPATDITYQTAILHGEMLHDGNREIVEKGFYYGLSANTQHTGTRLVVEGTEISNFETLISGINPTTVYYYRAFARNSAGEALGREMSFQTPGLPVVHTLAASSITNKSAVTSGEVIHSGGESIEERGIIWGTARDHLHETGTKVISQGHMGVFNIVLESLNEYTRYYFMAFATNSQGTSYGEILSFLTGGSVTDIDGNEYYSIMIGGMEWFSRNLVVTKYRNGDPIITNLSNAEWDNLSTGAYSIYSHTGFDATGINTSDQMVEYYGLLYNFFAVTDPRGLCPLGWHVPTKADWERLREIVGHHNAGGKLKSLRTQPDAQPRYVYPNANATNQIDFSGLPAGRRTNHGIYEDLGRTAYWWSRTTSSESPSAGNFIRLSHENGFMIFGIQNKKNGFSVRCIKN